MIYQAFIIVHSCVRWVLLVLGGGLAVRSWFTWTPRDTQLLKGFHHLIELQAFVGAVLYLVLSPLTQLGFSHFAYILTVPAIRFFTLEHAPIMIAALMWTYMGTRRALRHKDPRPALRLALTAPLLLICAAIPWRLRPLLPGLR